MQPTGPSGEILKMAMPMSLALLVDTARDNEDLLDASTAHGMTLAVPMFLGA